ncbi:MAG: 4-amino-4-deoxy-L-arabinose transferase [Nocardioides sp.]|nr:4-amino-4-deoxy-L-arabinose transferase [Nocardioides sp.]
MGPATELLALARRRPPTLGEARLICVDGPAGSGKTTLAATVAALDPAVRVVHLDDLYEGWAGLPRVADQLDDLLLPLARGVAGTYRRYDWAAQALAETVTVDPVPVLLLEGVGCGTRRHAPLVTALAWVEAPADVRLRRGLARDGEGMRPEWVQWQVDEAALFAREDTRARADLVVDTGTSAPS